MEVLMRFAARILSILQSMNRRSEPSVHSEFSRRRRLCLIFCLLVVASAAVGLPRIVAAETTYGNDRADGQCDPILLLSEFFDGVTPPTLPAGCRAPCGRDRTPEGPRHLGAPTPPAETPPNAVFVEDPATNQRQTASFAKHWIWVRFRQGAGILPEQLQLASWVRWRCAGG